MLKMAVLLAVLLKGIDVSGYQEKQNLTPAVDEFSGYYNVPAAWVEGLGVSVEAVCGDANVLLSTTEPIAPPDFEEHGRVSDWASAILPNFSPPYEAHGASAPSQYTLHFERDRTLVVWLHQPNQINKKNCELLLEELAKQFPLWRVILAMADPKDSVVIYPSACVIPAHWRSKADSYWHEIIQLQVAAFEDSSEGRCQRQALFVQQLLPGLKTAGKLKPGFDPFVVALFEDRYVRGNSERKSINIWFLTEFCKGEDPTGDYFSAVADPQTVEGYLGSSGEFGVTRRLLLHHGLEISRLSDEDNLFARCYRMSFDKEKFRRDKIPILDLRTKQERFLEAPADMPIWSEAEVRDRLSGPSTRLGN